MRKAVSIFIILSFSLTANAQQLVANGSLNDRNVCTEFHIACAPEAWFFIPTYILMSPSEDNNYFEVLSMGSIANITPPGKRDYLYTKLLCRLQEGRQYNFSVWINSGGNKFDHLDIWMGPREPTHLRMIRETFEPAFTLTTANRDSVRPRWTKYKHTFTAKGDEQFIMLGNLSKEGMDKSKVKALPLRIWVMYSIDNISLTPVEPSSNTCPEYNAVWKQVYDQDYRHPARLIESQPIDIPLITKPVDTLKQGVPVIWDTIVAEKKISDTLIIPDVLFNFNKSTLNPKFIKELDAITGKLKDRQFSALEVTGHTDSIGTDAYNVDLSERRAGTIKDYLMKKLGLPAAMITTKGMGEKGPRATNATAEGRQMNRRVEIILQRK
jgi:outer membrane protein OmpA-like peptidoglycan-associated protein